MIKNPDRALNPIGILPAEVQQSIEASHGDVKNNVTDEWPVSPRGPSAASSARRERWTWRPRLTLFPSTEKGTAPDLRSPAPSGHGIVTPLMTTGPSV